jgi:hypothetical protein
LRLYSSNSTTYQNYSTNNLAANTNGSEFWIPSYSVIFSCNQAIEELGASSGLTPAVKQQLMGEAYFIRALSFFYLVNLYGDVPLTLTSDYKVNESLGNTLSTDVYKQIIADLIQAKGLLSASYLDGTLLNSTTVRVRPTKWTAMALLAWAYLYSADWPDAIVQADSVIGNTALYGLDSLNAVFLSTSNEAIWQLQPTGSVPTNTVDGFLFIIPPTGPGSNWPMFLNPQLISSFEAGDLRRVDWTDSVVLNGTAYYYPFKYKVNSSSAPVSEYYMVIRLAELYLIRAEASAQNGDIAGAVSDLNMIRARAGLTSIAASPTPSAAQILSLIMHERRIELFTEMGHRWMDLKRTGAVDSVMTIATPLKGGVWHSYQQLYPILQSDVQADINLKQNQGY